MSDSEHRFTKGDGFVTRNIAGETIIVPVRGGVGDLDSIFTRTASARRSGADRSRLTVGQIPTRSRRSMRSQGRRQAGT